MGIRIEGSHPPKICGSQGLDPVHEREQNRTGPELILLLFALGLAP